MIRLAVFDLDGTLLDTLDDIAAVANGILEKNGFSPLSVETFKKKLIGNGAHEMMRRAVASVCADSEVIDRLAREFKAVYTDTEKSATQPYDGITQMLSTLQSRGIATAVLSNKPHGATVQMVEKYFPGIFETAVGNRDGVPLKPDPASLLALCESFGAGKEEVVYIGDSETDLFTANNAGVACISVSWGFRAREELLGYGAKTVADTAEDIAKYIGLISSI